MSFWIKNNGTHFKVNAGNVSPFEGEMEIILDSDEQLDEWKYFSYKINVPKERHLRMELNVIKPGTLWIDDVQIIEI